MAICVLLYNSGMPYTCVCAVHDGADLHATDASGRTALDVGLCINPANRSIYIEQRAFKMYAKSRSCMVGEQCVVGAGGGGRQG